MSATLTRSGIELAGFLQLARIDPGRVVVTLEFDSPTDCFDALVALQKEFPFLPKFSPSDEFTLAGVRYKMVAAYNPVPGLLNQ